MFKTLTPALLVSMLFPNMLFGAPIGQLFILFVFAGLCLVLIFDVKKTRIPLPLFAFIIVLMVLLLISIMLSESDYTLAQLPSALRPMLLLLIVLAALRNLRDCAEEFEYIDRIKRTFQWLVCISIVFVVFERTSDAFQELMFSLYVREEKNFYGSVTFFWVPYYAGFVYHTTAAFFVSRLIFLGFSVSALFYFIASVFLVLVTQSTGSLIGLAVLVFLVIFVITFGLFEKVRLLIRFSLFFTLLLLAGAAIFYLDSYIGLTYAFRTLDRLADHGASVGTVAVRLDQIYHAFEYSARNAGFGAGLARGEDLMQLESWISQITYRYGILGLIAYPLIFIYFATRLLRALQHSNDIRRSQFLFFGIIWVFTLPLAMISGFQIETGKTLILCWFLIGILWGVSSVGNQSRSSQNFKIKCS